MPAESPKLLDRVRYALCIRHFAIRTDEAYWFIRQLVLHYAASAFGGAACQPKSISVT